MLILHLRSCVDKACFNIIEFWNGGLKYAEEENETSENLGARRLHTVLELLLEDISFNAGGDHPMIEVVIDKEYVTKAFASFNKNHDLRKYVL